MPIEQTRTIPVITAEPRSSRQARDMWSLYSWSAHTGTMVTERYSNERIARQSYERAMSEHVSFLSTPRAGGNPPPPPPQNPYSVQREASISADTFRREYMLEIDHADSPDETIVREAFGESIQEALDDQMIGLIESGTLTNSETITAVGQLSQLRGASDQGRRVNIDSTPHGAPSTIQNAYQQWNDPAAYVVHTDPAAVISQSEIAAATISSGTAVCIEPDEVVIEDTTVPIWLIKDALKAYTVPEKYEDKFSHEFYRVKADLVRFYIECLKVKGKDKENIILDETNIYSVYGSHYVTTAFVSRGEEYFHEDINHYVAVYLTPAKHQSITSMSSNKDLVKSQIEHMNTAIEAMAIWLAKNTNG